MANEFVARKGLISSGSINVSGSVTASFFKGDGNQLTNISNSALPGGILSSSTQFNALSGTSASFATTASFALTSAGGGNALSSSVVVESYTFVGNDITTNYQISKSYNDSSVTVTVGGLTYINPNDYSISGSTIVFVEPPLSSSNISVKALMNVAQNATGSFSGSFAGDGRGLTNISANTTIDTYTFVGNGATTVYNIVNTYYGNSVFVTVEGLTQTQTLDYTLSSNIVTFLTAPPSESNILVRALVNTTNQATGSFSGSFLGIVSNATSASYAITASFASQFTVGGVTTTAGISSSNHITPSVDNTYNLGAPDKRWANIYTGDLNLSNEGSSGNIVDGTTGNWTVQEGQEYLYIINNKSGKKYRFMLEESK